jgi:hypothetical protein
MEVKPNAPIVRKAIYHAYKGKCFYTCRLIKPDQMEIDHLIPVSKGGKNCFENYVLTCKDINLGKSNKCDDEILRMSWAVKNIYAPRAKRYYKEYKNKIDLKIKKDDFEKKILIKQFKTRITPPEELKLLWEEDLIWVHDKQVRVLLPSEILNSMSDDDKYLLKKSFNIFSKFAIENDSDFCFDAEVTRNLTKQLRNLWFDVRGNYFKPVQKIRYYDGVSHLKWKWAYVYFTQHYINFLDWKTALSNCLEDIFEIEDDSYHKKLEYFCKLFPSPKPILD